MRVRFMVGSKIFATKHPVPLCPQEKSTKVPRICKISTTFKIDTSSNGQMEN